MASVYQLPLPDPDRLDGFGSTLDRKSPHRGVDFPAPGGTPFRAVADGTVALIEYSAALGWVTVLRHTRSPADVLRRRKPVYSGYAHQDVHAALSTGDRVKRGDVIGRVGFRGHNGSSASGEHLHLTMSHELRGVFAGEVFDPLAFIARYPGAMKAGKPKPARTYVVKHGDNLWTIAKDHGNGRSWQDIAEANGLEDPTLIYPGQRLKL